MRSKLDKRFVNVQTECRLRALLFLVVSLIAAVPVWVVGEDLELRDLDVSDWNCLNRLEGTAKTPDGVERNRMKNRAAIDLSGAHIEALDTVGFLKKIREYDAVLQAARRAQLSKPRKEQLDSFEKQLVSLTGWLVVSYAGPPESTNCGDKVIHDWHVEIFEQSSDHPPRVGDPTPIICEITPRMERDLYRAGVRIQSLAGFLRLQDKSYQSTGHTAKKIRVTGYLMWDDDHNGKADVGASVENFSKNGFHHPWRSTAWEIHPILKIEAVDGEPAAASQASPSSERPVLPAEATATPAPRITDAQAQEVRKLYPDMLRRDSPLYKEIWKRYEAYRSSNPRYFDDPNWPSVLAKECADNLGIKSKE